MNDFIEIFGTQIKKYQLYGIYVNTRKPNQTQNITSTFKVSTLIENYEFEYSCDLQWLDEYQKKKIIKYLLLNNGKKINMLKSLFFDTEGLISVKIGEDCFYEVLADYESVSVTRKTGNFYDLKIKLKIVTNLNPSTWADVKTKTWEEIKTQTWEDIQNGGIDG